MPEPSDTRIILEEALAEVDRECHEHARCSYFAMVPPKFQPAVNHLAQLNFAYYAREFGGDRASFREQMARNWLVKSRAFNALVRRAGMVPFLAIGAPGAPRHPNLASFAILTQNASYLLVGPGAFDKSGPGASYRYTRIPLRKGENVPNMEGPEGLKFKKTPRIGRRATTSKVETSPIAAICAGVVEGELASPLSSDLGPHIDETFTLADTATLGFHTCRRAHLEANGPRAVIVAFC